jgi:hypothetical protein
MKIAVTIGLALAATALVPIIADAAPRSRSGARNPYHQSYNSIRAHERDPAGNYRGYPNWARSALSPKGGD